MSYSLGDVFYFFFLFDIYIFSILLLNIFAPITTLGTPNLDTALGSSWHSWRLLMEEMFELV